MPRIQDAPLSRIVRKWSAAEELVACGHLLPVLYYHKTMGARKRRRCMKCLLRKRRDIAPHEFEKGEGTMGTYTVTVEQIRHYTLEIEASTIDAATAKARQASDLDGLGAEVEVMGQVVIKAQRDD